MIDNIPLYLISIIRAKAEHPVLASFRRDVSFAYFPQLDSKILFDSGSQLNFITEKTLSSIPPSKIKRIDYHQEAFYCNGTKRNYEELLLIDFPLSECCIIKQMPFIPTERPYTIIGKDLFDYVTVQFTREEINILSAPPSECLQSLPLVEQDDSYYIELEVNGRKNLFYLDTGYAEAITMPTTDMKYAIGKITRQEETLYVDTQPFPIVDYVENSGSVKIGSLEKHGPIVYSDYHNKKYIINPSIVLKDFEIDLCGRKLIVK